MTAADRVIWLLRTIDSARSDYYEGAGSGVRLMPRDWHHYKHLECDKLPEMRERERQLWWHTVWRYRYGEVRSVTVPVNRKKRAPGCFVLNAFQPCELEAATMAVGERHARVRVYAWHPDVRQELADSGVKWLVSHLYDGKAELITLPQVVMQRAMVA